MAKAIIKPVFTESGRRLSGVIRAVSSKSYAHRFYIAAALANADTQVICNDISEDIEATRDCVNGLKSLKRAREALAGEFLSSDESVLIHCRESGSTLRFLLPVAAALLENESSFKFTGTGNLPERPIGELMDVLSWKSVEFSSEKLPFSVSGKLRSGDFKISGNISSQYISGLLLALPLLKGDSRIILENKQIQSESYVEITRDVLRRFGILTMRTEYGYYVKGSQTYKSPGRIEVEGDWSNAAFFYAANKLGSSVELTGLNHNSNQGDMKIVKLLENWGEPEFKNDEFDMVIDLTDIPDLFPILAVVAAFQPGTTVFKNVERLKLKESDRIESTKAMLISLGLWRNGFELFKNSLVIEGGFEYLKGGIVKSFNDHRIVMAAAIAATRCKGPTVIEGCEAVKKSYPRFFEDYKKLGGDVVVSL
ncbi:MAG: 3-phosphoshikimate 1-carboxyvinyltransferase [Oscillospiraceae bacterium]|nr:3-phosphoshikimate 1-carboxyvinyltransferase [Oscillospiraceae bacterium]